MSAQKRAALASSWSDLPQEIISKIGTRLDSAIDVCRLHSVCKNWHCARNPNHRGLLCPFLPRIVTNNNLPFTDRQHDPVILIARAVFLVKPRGYPPPSCGWLLTVEEMVPGKLRILYPLSNDRVKHLPSNCPKFLDFTKFKVSQVDKSYGLKYESDDTDVPDVRRVVLCSGSTVMVLFGGGTLIRLSFKSGNWSFVRHSILHPFTDVISYNGNHVRAIDLKGIVSVIDHKAAKVVTTISANSIIPGSAKINLLRSNEKLFAVAYVHGQFVIYRLDEVQNEWLVGVARDYCSKVLFISCDWSFFLYTYELNLYHYSPKPKNANYMYDDNDSVFDDDIAYEPKEKEEMAGDYVIYSEKSFPCSSECCFKSRLYEGADLYLGISVFFFNRDDVEYWKKEPHCTSTTIDVLWPPPAWFWPDIHSSSSDDEELLDIKGRNDLQCCEKDTVPSIAADTSTRTVTACRRVATFTSVTDYHALTIQNSNQNSLTLVFEGINVRSNLIPTMQKIWEKHGNIVEGSTIRNADIIARALESLATTVIILQSNSGHSLSKDQADYISSTLCDLQQMKYNVNWLVPFVEKAIAIHKSRPLINAFKDFDKVKAQAEEMKKKVLDELAKLDEVEEDMILVSERLSGLKSMDFDQVLGDGLC